MKKWFMIISMILLLGSASSVNADYYYDGEEDDIVFSVRGGGKAPINPED